MTSDIYTKLSGGPKSMRMFYLAPSNNFGHVSLVSRLAETTYDECGYEALSYCWGDQNKKLPILVDGEEFLVTRDLENALRHLCLPDRSRALWIDAICINQKDADEKSVQVQRMKDIYNNAERVIVWLGEATDQTELAFKQVRKLMDSPDADTEKAIWGEQGKWIACLNELLKRRYWYRAWTVQEVVLARDAELYCGPHSLPFFAFAHFLLHPTTRNHVKVGYSLSSYLEQVFEMRKASHQDPPLGLFGLAYKLRHRQCTVSHDRLFSFLGLLTEESIPGGKFSVDYTIDTEKLWLNFSKEIMTKYNSLLPIALAEETMHDSTWCYNWSTKAREPNDVLHDRTLFWTGGLDSPDFYPLQSAIHSAAAGLPARIRVDLQIPAVIAAQGFSCGKITKTGKSVAAFLIGFGRPNYGKLFAQWETLVGGPWENPEMLRKFSSTVTGGAWSVEPANWREWNRNTSERAWNLKVFFDDVHETTGYNMNRHANTSENETLEMYYRVRDDACEKRRIFLLDNGEFGLGPEEAKVGDEVVILLGCQVPLVLRKRDYTGLGWFLDPEEKAKQFDSIWKVVGQAYVHDRMQYKGDLEQDIKTGKVVLDEYFLD